MSDILAFQVATRVLYGPGAVTQIGAEAAALGGKRALIVTDQGVVKAGVVDQVISSLQANHLDYVVFDAVEPNPSMETVERGLELFRREQCDCLIGVGGGSSMDAAKGIGILASHDGPLTKYAGIGKVYNPLPLLLAVPTTVGTGSEVTIFAVITDRSRHLKMSIGSRLLVPKLAILDPELTMSLPDSLVASTGIDALTHAIEAYISLQANPFSDTMALGAMRLIAAHIRAAVGERSPEAMAGMLYASCMAGVALSHSRVTLIHGMSHPLGGYYDVPHGLANAILLPYVLEFNIEACSERLATIAEALGEDIRSLRPQAAAEKAIKVVRRICADVGIPLHLREVGMTEEYIPQMAAGAVESGPAKANPRQPTLEDVIALYHKAL